MHASSDIAELKRQVMILSAYQVRFSLELIADKAFLDDLEDNYAIPRIEYFSMNQTKGMYKRFMQIISYFITRQPYFDLHFILNVLSGDKKFSLSRIIDPRILANVKEIDDFGRYVYENMLKDFFFKAIMRGVDENN